MERVSSPDIASWLAWRPLIRELEFLALKCR